MRIVLASKSPRRREILNNIGVKFDVVESNFEEVIDYLKSPSEIVKHLAMKKAENVACTIKDSALIVGADTIVVYDSMIMGKPKNEFQSYDMLKKLSGKWHNVYTGICVMDSVTGKYSVDFENTSVKIKILSDEDINLYISSGEPNDKAGSYAIQGIGSLIVERIEGCYFNVVGLPIFKLSALFDNFGINLLKFRG